MLGLWEKNYILQGARSVRRFHACPLRAPEGLGDLTKKIPKGDVHFQQIECLISVFWFRFFPLPCIGPYWFVCKSACLCWSLNCCLCKGMGSQLRKYTRFNFNTFNPAVFWTSKSKLVTMVVTSSLNYVCKFQISYTNQFVCLVY